MNKKVLSTMLTVCMGATILGGVCAAAEGEQKTVAIIPKIIGNPYFNAAEVGAKRAGEENGFEVIYSGPTDADATQQYNMVEDFIAQGVDAISIAPNDAAGLTPALKKAKEAGIAVMDWDSAAEKDVVDYSLSQVDLEELGVVIFKELFESIGKEEGTYAILTGGLEAENLNVWIEAGMKWAEENYPGMKLVTDKIPTNEKQQEAYSKTLDLMKAYPDLDGIVAGSTPAPVGAGQAIQELGLQDQVSIVGTGMPKDCKEYLMDGSVDVAVLWDIYREGYTAAYLAWMDANGEEIVDGTEIPGYGPIRVLEDGKSIIMGEPLLITAENVDEFDY